MCLALTVGQRHKAVLACCGKHICVDVIKIILALVYLMTAKCYILSMNQYLSILTTGTETKVFVFLNLSHTFPLLERGHNYPYSFLSWWKLLLS